MFHEHLQAIPRRKGLRVQNSAILRKAVMMTEIIKVKMLEVTSIMFPMMMIGMIVRAAFTGGERS